ncbi:MAG: tRNA pseudouridine(55) synthase TruB [Acidobacteria bacterium]|nr:tRNA pseudouridine(55) synthase TruB [Acidobacteriota bacterium]
MDAVLIIDKPAGFTSHDVVARVRRLLREKRVGHTGTLDPFATGVLVVLCGRATRLAQFLSGAEKVYEATIRFGHATETGDVTGAVRPETRAPVSSHEFARDWDAAKIEAALQTLRGEIEQVPPMYSAKKVQGRKLYELARAGASVERAAVRVTVQEFEALLTGGLLLRHEADGTCLLTARVRCSAGTYVRTLAESLGERLGVGAHLLSLRRTRAGDFSIEQAVTLEELQRLADEGGAMERWLLPLSAALKHLGAARLTDEAARAALHGRAVRAAEDYRDGQLVGMYDGAGQLIAVAAYDEGAQALRPRVVLASEK